MLIDQALDQPLPDWPLRIRRSELGKRSRRRQRAENPPGLNPKHFPMFEELELPY